MHEELLARAARPAPAIVLGLLLKPYSLGHELCLIRAANPLAESDKATPLQLAEAVLICSQSWRENEQTVLDPLFTLKLWLWKTRLRGIFRRRRISLESDLTLFCAYRDAGSLEFPLSQLPGSGLDDIKIPGCPFLLRLQQFLMRELHLTEEQAWDYHYGLAKCRWCEWYESNGALSVYNYVEHAHDQAVAKQRARARGN